MCPVNEQPGQIVQSAAVCPWDYVLHTDETRSPANILTAVAQCQSCLDPYTYENIAGTTCKGVDYEIPVRYGAENGTFRATVAFVCLRVKTAEVNPPTTEPATVDPRQPTCDPPDEAARERKENNKGLLN